MSRARDVADIAGIAVPDTILDAKGDLIAASGADTPARLAPGSNGDVLHADSSATNGLRWQPAYNAGRNRIINGGFDLWQRGTSFSNPANASYTADRWVTFQDGTFSGSVSRQAFDPGQHGTFGCDPTYFLRKTTTSQTSGTYNTIQQRIEDVRTFAGQTITISFWAKSNANRTIGYNMSQWFGSGGSSPVYPTEQSASLTTTWQRFTATISLASISGKTIGSSSYLQFEIVLPVNTTFTFDIWGVQVEAGSVATRFEEEPYEATLRKCQRYYYRLEPGASSRVLGTGQATGGASSLIYVPFPTTMRTRPTALEQSGTAAHYGLLNNLSALVASNVVPAFDAGTTADRAVLFGYVASGLTAGNATAMFTNNSAAYLAWSAEL